MNKEVSQVPLLDLKAQYKTIRSEIVHAIEEVIESQYFIGGPKLKIFEENIAKYCQTKFALGVSSGTDAILLALMALGIGSEDEVIVPVYSFFATAGCVSRVNAKPVFVDIDPDTFNIDAAKIENLISSKTKAIIPVHLYGQLAEMDAIKKIADKHNISVIEDAAQAIGAMNEKQKAAGTFGDIGCFSFFPSKNLGAFGDGGLVTTDSETLYNIMEYMKNHGANPKYYHKMIGGNFRLDAIQAAILDIKLSYLDKWTEGRQKNALYYDRGFEERNLIPFVTTPFKKSGYRHIFNQYILRCKDRDELLQFLQKKNIGCEIYYPVTFNNQECFKYLGYKRGDFPEAEKAADETIAIPIYPELENHQKDYIMDSIMDFYKNN
jgi:dTDP-4-amino-4,6-dideoxygalactose transaminase